ncbi:MAG TPA: glycosyltransferase, partial [Candidatus Omnitrophota bacterium]|nr:glycosyltransferase [Candidatus Omnitrophota bacterium]
AMSRKSFKAFQKGLQALGWYKGKVDGKDGPLTRSAVRTLQTILRDELGFSKLPVNGQYDDPATLAAIKELQGKLKVKVDGVLGPETASSLKKHLEELRKKGRETQAVTGQGVSEVLTPHFPSDPATKVLNNPTLQAGFSALGFQVIQRLLVSRQLVPNTQETRNFIYTYLYETHQIVQTAKQKLTDPQFQRVFHSKKSEMTPERVAQLAIFVFDLNNHESMGHVHIKNKRSSAFSQAQILIGTRKELFKNPLFKEITGITGAQPVTEKEWEEFLVTGSSANRNRIAMVIIHFLRAPRDLPFDELFSGDTVKESNMWGKYYHTQSPKGPMEAFKKKADRHKDDGNRAKQYYLSQVRGKGSSPKDAVRAASGARSELRQGDIQTAEVRPEGLRDESKYFVSEIRRLISYIGFFNTASIAALSGISFSMIRFMFRRLPDLKESIHLLSAIPLSILPEAQSGAVFLLGAVFFAGLSSILSGHFGLKVFDALLSRRISLEETERRGQMMFDEIYRESLTKDSALAKAMEKTDGVFATPVSYDVFEGGVETTVDEAGRESFKIRLSPATTISKSILRYLIVRRSIGIDFRLKTRALRQKAGNSPLFDLVSNNFWWGYYGESQTLRRWRYFPVMALLYEIPLTIGLSSFAPIFLLSILSADFLTGNQTVVKFLRSMVSVFVHGRDVDEIEFQGEPREKLVFGSLRKAFAMWSGIWGIVEGIFAGLVFFATMNLQNLSRTGWVLPVWNLLGFDWNLLDVMFICGSSLGIAFMWMAYLVYPNEKTRSEEVVEKPKKRSEVRDEGYAASGARSELRQGDIQTALSRSEARGLVSFSETPVDWDKVFTVEGPLVVEVGFGDGDILAAESEQHPQWRHVGIELPFGNAKERLGRNDPIDHLMGKDNVRVILHDARESVAKMFEDGTVAQFRFFYPDPRVDFFDKGCPLRQEVWKKLKPGGSIILVTEDVAYAKFVRKVFSDQGFEAWNEEVEIFDFVDGAEERRARQLAGIPIKKSRYWRMYTSSDDSHARVVKAVKPDTRSETRGLVSFSETPVDWDKVFTVEGPLVVEVGFGDGDILAAESEQHPQWRHVGIELPFGNAKERLGRNDPIDHLMGKDNVRVILHDARESVAKMFEDGTVAQFRFFYPDPRVDFFDKGCPLRQEVWKKLKPGGSIILVTEDVAYAKFVRKVFSDQGFEAWNEEVEIFDFVDGAEERRARQLSGIPIKESPYWQRLTASDDSHARVVKAVKPKILLEERAEESLFEYDVRIRDSKLPEKIPSDFVILSPVFNEQDQLPGVLENIKRRKYSEDVIFVDDGSSDGTAEILRASGVYFISFAQNARKESALLNAMAVLRKHHHRVPEYFVAVDGDSYLAGTGQGILRAELEKSIQEMEKGGYVARPIDIEAHLTARSGTLEWLQGIRWYLTMGICAVYSKISFPSPSFWGGGNIFKTQAFLDVVAKRKADFESGDVELNGIAGSMGKVGKPLSTVKVRTEALKKWDDFIKQQRRWARAQFEGTPSWFFAGFLSGLVLFDVFILLNLPAFMALMMVSVIMSVLFAALRHKVTQSQKFASTDSSLPPKNIYLRTDVSDARSEIRGDEFDASDYGLMRGRLSRDSERTLGFLTEYFSRNQIAGDDANLIARTLVRMKPRSLELLRDWGVLTEKEPELITSGNMGKIMIPQDIRNSLAQRMRLLLKSYDERGYTRAQKDVLMSRLIPVDQIDAILTRSPDLTDGIVIEMLDSRFSLIFQIDRAIEVAASLRKSGVVPSLAWRILIKQGPDQALSWASAAKVVVERIKDAQEVSGQRNAWLMIMNHGIEKVEKAERRGKLSELMNAWKTRSELRQEGILKGLEKKIQ